MTSAEEFPEETQVPPVVVDTPDLPIGSIVAFDLNNENELRLNITVRDDNIDDDLEIQARLSVVGQSMPEYVCDTPIMKTQEPQRAQSPLIVDRSKIRPGACTKVEIAVSSRFARPCATNPELFGIPLREDDVGRATFWIWEMSGNPAANPTAAQGIVTSCALLTTAPSTSMPTKP
ncbi:MAG TPA: hypothetical protein VFG30_10240 [Polyangiales bacterium]|nr:hypothetical protein [Polyangiales bacterium]